MTNEDARKVLSWIEVKGRNELIVGTWYYNIDKELREALDLAIAALEQEPCEDAISREQLLSTMFDLPKPKTNKTYWDGVDDVGELVNDLPPVQPKQRTGMWVEWKDSVYNCSVCGCHTDEQALFNYCPNCGAKMEVEG